MQDKVLTYRLDNPTREQQAMIKALMNPKYETSKKEKHWEIITLSNKTLTKITL